MNGGKKVYFASTGTSRYQRLNRFWFTFFLNIFLKRKQKIKKKTSHLFQVPLLPLPAVQGQGYVQSRPERHPFNVLTYGSFNWVQWELKQGGHGATVAHFDTRHVHTQWHPLHTLPQPICSFYLFVSHTFLKTESLIIIWRTKKRAFQTSFPLSSFTTLAPWHFFELHVRCP